MSELFDAVDALIAKRSVLPSPAERERLRKAHGLTQDELADALRIRRATVVSWEKGKTEPRPPQREAYARLLDKLAELYPVNAAAPEPVMAPSAPLPPVPPAPAPAAAPVAAPATSARPAPTSVPPRAPTPTQAWRNPVKQPAPVRTAKPAAVSDPDFPSGPLAVLDGDGTAYCVGGLILECPATSLPALVDWTLTQSGLGASRLHRSGKDLDPLIVLTESAAVRFGLPAGLPDDPETRRTRRLPADHKVIAQITKAKWQLTKRGFGPWARIYRPSEGGKRNCVQLSIPSWGALDQRTWGIASTLAPADLAQVLGSYAARVITPRGSSAVAGLELMTALRPPTRAVRDEATDTWVSGPVPGSLTRAVDPAPPEAPDEHPVVAALYPRNHQRTPAEVLDEEAYDWIRDPEELTDDECETRFAVGIDVNTAFLAAANRLIVGLGEAVHVKRPVFDKKTPGSWLVDLAGIELDPRLPSPFTPHGMTPTGPAWYATPTVAYAQELIGLLGLQLTIHPIEAYVRPQSGTYLDPWYTRLSDAYKATMADLRVTSDLAGADFLAAMEQHKDVDPGQAAVLSAIKATVKGGIGKLRERPQGAKYRPGESWPALERPTWRPDIRAAVISAARVNMHRKMLRMSVAGLYPIAVLSDCAVYLSDGPTPLDFLPHTEDGKPLPGTFRLGVSPGMVKHEGTQELMWAVHMLDEGHNPARHIKGVDAADDGE
ncbi:helix-turn-helix transcriptional regulator [Streptomyces sp. H10-C2]|uniref:telomere-associated protein Tap n=1 Tax=unclassified Streptomyces TaxID=2593676 RepID=UPI0024B99EBD|nr:MULTISPECIES: helix-turn-helix transcriptional regulator [unclassified Streptomyces]MDJ0345863.1 helix-turn-helix transcriptional regulator [Streptomyces sp. PH10-H1]MDJ0371171.1 helix-turn-helix transcriptional regulator [Streptomyces sp. H10-C2]